MIHDDFMQDVYRKLYAAKAGGTVPVEDLAECYNRLEDYGKTFQKILAMHGVTTCGQATCFEEAQEMAKLTLEGAKLPED